MSRGSPNPQSQSQMDTGSLTRPGVVDPEKFFQKYEAMKEDYDSLRKRYADLIASHSGTVNKLELAQEEVNRVKKLYEEALQETSGAIRERNGLKQQCTAAIRQWDSALRERNEYKEALGKVQQQHEEAMKEINQAMAVRIKSNKDIKRLTEERDAVSQEISLIMSERDSVHRELEKLTDDLAQSKKQIKALETQNKELADKVQEAVQEAEVSKRRRDWAFVERDKIVRERESLRTLCDRLRRERDRAVSDLAEALSESEDIKKQKNLASKQLKELRERFEMEKENRSIRFQYLSNSSSFSESRDSAIDSDMPSGHYSIRLPNVRGADHGLVLEPGVYISRIVPGSPAAKEMNLNIGDRVLFINDTPIDNVQDAILALSEDIDPIMLTLSRSAGQLSSPINSNNNPNNKTQSNQVNSKSSAHASTSSLKSDITDAHNVISRRHAGGGKSGIRDIFRVRLPRKKLSSPEEAILATLDSAIDSGANTSNTASHNSRKNRKKRTSSRNSGGESSVNKNGTWPRVINRNSACSYTLPQDVSVGTGINPRGISENPSSGPGVIINHHNRGESVFYGQYIPMNSSNSNTVCIRRPSSGKDRTPISNLWDYPAKSVGAIAIGSAGGNTTVSGGSMSINSKSLTLAAGGRSVGGGIAIDNNGLPTAPNAGNPHHRYSFGVFDPSPSNKIGKGVPERNSVVPTLTMSDGSSIDFSVKSGNMEILEYYVKRMVKNQNNSSESDHLDKVVTPPSLAIPNVPVGSGNNSNVLGQSTLTSTLDRFPNRQVYPPRYSVHHHDVPGSIPVSASAGGTMHIPKMSMPKSNNSFAFEPTFHHTHSHGGNNETPSTSLSLSSSAGNKINLFRNSDDLLLHPPSYPIPIEPSGTFPRKSREAQRIRIPSNQSVTSRSSTEKFDLRNSPMPTYHIEVLDPGAGSHSGASDFGTWPRKPASGELRKVRIDKYDKSTEPLGIQISCKANGGGVFVSSVTEHSLASQVGLQIGDQLLEVCGINMRTATYELAANVLRQCGDCITMLVQYSPEKYREDYEDGSSSDDSQSHSDGESSSSPDQDENNSSLSENESRSGSRSGSPTPCNSPQSTLVRNTKKNSSMQNHNQSQNSGSNTNSLTTKSTQSSSVKNKDQRSSGGDRSGNSIQNSSANNSLTKAAQQTSSSGQSGGGGVLGVGQQVQSQSQQQQQIKQAFNIAAASGEDNPPSEQSTLRSNRSGAGGGEVTDGKILLQEKTRFLTLQLMKNSSNLGVCLVGGNVVGIYVHSVQKDSIADRSGLRTGDQILEYNGTDLRHATAEEAAFELAKPLDKVGVLVLYNLKRYNEIKDQPGDGFYIRALFDYPSLSNDHHHQHQGNSPDPQQLSFLKDEILYVDNTMYNGKPGRWRAWKVDSEGHRRAWGVIPSKFKVEEDLMFKRSLGDLDSDRRTSTVTRRSFFRRKSHHRSSSRELASFSDFSINSYGDLSAQLGGLQLKDDAVLAMNSYQRVERLDYMCCLRPVLILGALSDLVSERVCQDYSYQFSRVPIEVMHCNGPMLEKGLAENLFVDYKRKGSHYECVTMAAIKETSAKKLYCILDVSTAGVERLQRAQMYPIVLLVKFKNPKQIREIKDLRCEKISQKAAKELYEHSLKVEIEYKHLITACVPGGTNISYLATQVKTSVEKEQSKTLWVPV